MGLVRRPRAVGGLIALCCGSPKKRSKRPDETEKRRRPVFHPRFSAGFLASPRSVFIIPGAVVRRGCAPHLPPVVGRVAGFQAEQRAACGTDEHAAADHRRLEQHRLAERHRPQLVSCIRREAQKATVGRAEEQLSVHHGRRGRRGIEHLAAAIDADWLFPQHLLRVRLDAVDRVALPGVHPPARQERLRSLVSPDRRDVPGAEVVDRLVRFHVARVRAEPDRCVVHRVSLEHGGPGRALAWSR